MSAILQIVGKEERPITPITQQKRVSEEDLVKAENLLRNEAKALVQDISNKYWDLGRVLYEVYDGVPGGYRGLMTGDGSKTKRVSLFEKWGYKGFGEYCEQEVLLQKRTGENLRYAYYYFAIQQEMSKEVIERLVSIGRSKVYLLSGFATRDNITLWMDKANELTFEDLKKAITLAKSASSGRNTDNEESEMAESPLSSESVPVSVASPSKPLHKPEVLHTIQAGLYDAQLETWQSALSQAQGLTGSEKIGHNLELICQDFLSNNNFSKVKEKDFSSYISKMERRLGLLMIAIDPNTGKPVHGGDLLWKLVSESEKQDE
jgi:hypothetical protein